MKVLLYLITIFVLSSCSQLSDEEIFVQIMDDEWSRLTKNNPVYASSMGILDRNQEWSDYSVSAELEDNEHNVTVLNKLLTLDYKSFSNFNKTNYALFVKEFEDDIEEHSFGTFYMPFSHRGGIQLLHETTSVLPFRTTEHYYDWISRLQKIPIVIDQIIEKASIGIEKNIVPPFVLMNRVYEQIKLQANVSSVNSPFNKHFLEIDTSRFDIDEIVLIQSKALETIDELVIPAYQKLLIFFENEYLPNIRKTIGIKDIPDGKKYYEFIARKFTTTDLTPLEIHNI
jgi:prolyl oligopeptidase